jgi:hypothetical protein
LKPAWSLIQEKEGVLGGAPGLISSSDKIHAQAAQRMPLPQILISSPGPRRAFLFPAPAKIFVCAFAILFSSLCQNLCQQLSLHHCFIQLRAGAKDDQCKSLFFIPGAPWQTGFGFFGMQQPSLAKNSNAVEKPNSAGSGWLQTINPVFSCNLTASRANLMATAAHQGSAIVSSALQNYADHALPEAALFTMACQPFQDSFTAAANRRLFSGRSPSTAPPSFPPALSLLPDARRLPRFFTNHTQHPQAAIKDQSPFSAFKLRTAAASFQKNNTFSCVQFFHPPDFRVDRPLFLNDPLHFRTITCTFSAYAENHAFRAWALGLHAFKLSARLWKNAA